MRWTSKAIGTMIREKNTMKTAKLPIQLFERVRAIPFTAHARKKKNVRPTGFPV